ncbi:MAG: hypothetical protein HPY66_2378 [Firmicutes bacterium]|nr:hypothetical protein [Bacillota bacterium]
MNYISAYGQRQTHRKVGTQSHGPKASYIATAAGPPVKVYG